ncbi:hypothetical protein CFC21_026165 [Triticum aestivum]|uniref:SPRY domain-containing protein n=2 Tax=Triticum aestivum TaxID=4565 RepID=A0A3B6CFD2_WHEAT|nr:heterogeneous nuclear ribonucleoprotein U-like protein 1 [Triticum aestivum]KAF7011914.1 hypothetical protein CFC21_026165 [Triticum aestivum]
MATRPGDETAQPPPKRPRHDGDQADPEPAPPRVQLNPADCNLDFDVGAGGLRGEALHGGGFAYCWSGARATAGARGGGRYCFGCRVVAEQAVEMGDTEAAQRHLCRVGVSRGDDPVGGLGEAGGRGFGFGGTGKLSHRGRFFDYGATFGVGDTVVCAVDLDSKPMASIGFAKNGEWLGIAHYFDAGHKGLGLVDAPVRPMQWESAIFPHVLLKNVVVEMQFSREDGLEPVDGYEPWTSAFADGNAVFGPVFAEQKECEVMMMVGLPASGKTTWAEKCVREHPEKRFVLLGTNLALDQMKVPGLLRKNNYGERFDRLMDHATQIFNTLLDRAAKIPRNYILDQTNVYKSARIRKLRPFANYYKIAVVVFPSPSELNSRAAKRFQEMGKDVPAEAVDQMTANFVLPLSKDMPGSKEPFDEVIFVELSRDDAQRNLDEMKRVLPRASTPSHGNVSNQMAGPSPLSGFEPPMNYSYGQGVHAPGAPAGYSNAPYQTQPSYSNAPYQQQTYASYPNPSYPNTADQHQVHASYPSTADQHQVHTSYTSTANQHQAYGSYASTANQHQAYGSYASAPLPGYGSPNAYGSQGYPSPYSSPDYATSLYQTPEPAGDYMGSGYGPAAPVHAQTSGYVPAAPVHAQPLPPAVHQRHDGASSWSPGSYGPYGQQPLDARYTNTRSQYGAAVPMPPPNGALLHPVPGPPPSAPPPPPYYMNAQPGRW